jgi:hypothetical protein
MSRVVEHTISSHRLHSGLRQLARDLPSSDVWYICTYGLEDELATKIVLTKNYTRVHVTTDAAEMAAYMQAIIALEGKQ